MKKPKEPCLPYKPYAPKKKILYCQRISLRDYKHKSLQHLIDSFPKNLLLSDMIIYEEQTGDCCNSSVEYYFLYNEEIDNVQYDSQLERYKKEKKLYDETLAKNKSKIEKYEKENILYNEYMRNRVELNREDNRKKEIAELKKKLAKLESKNK